MKPFPVYLPYSSQVITKKNKDISEAKLFPVGWISMAPGADSAFSGPNKSHLTTSIETVWGYFRSLVYL